MASTGAFNTASRAGASGAAAASAQGYGVPLVVAVTGHRDLLPSEIPAIRGRVRRFLCDLRDAYPGRIVAVMSPLAEGADRIVAEEAITLRLPLHVPLPMPRDLSVQDFA